jgi:hypothetical protein
MSSIDPNVPAKLICAWQPRCRLPHFRSLEVIRQSETSVIGILMYMLLRSPCKNLKSYENPFWCFSNGGKKNNKRNKFPLVTMGVLAPGSEHTKPSVQPPINTSGNFPPYVSAE